MTPARGIAAPAIVRAAEGVRRRRVGEARSRRAVSASHSTRRRRQTEGGARPPVIAAGERDYLVAAGHELRDPQRGFVGLRAGTAEERPGALEARDPSEALRELDTRPRRE